MSHRSSAHLYDRKYISGTELRAFAGLLHRRQRDGEALAACHFGYPMRGCTVELDGVKVVDEGRLAADSMCLKQRR